MSAYVTIPLWLVFLPRITREHALESIRDARDEGRVLPPITVRNVGTHYKIVDGNHRVAVALERGDRTITARIERS